MDNSRCELVQMRDNEEDVDEDSQVGRARDFSRICRARCLSRVCAERAGQDRGAIGESSYKDEKTIKKRQETKKK